MQQHSLKTYFVPLAQERRAAIDTFTYTALIHVPTSQEPIPVKKACGMDAALILASMLVSCVSIVMVERRMALKFHAEHLYNTSGDVLWKRNDMASRGPVRSLREPD